MATSERSGTQSSEMRSRSVLSVAVGRRFEWWALATGIWLQLGVFLDGWAHQHLRTLERFFTPWHGVLYSGLLASVSLMGGVALRNWRRGQPIRTCLPKGYELSFIGALIFGVGGLGDGLWHFVFGVEEGLEALLSPTHLALAVGAVLILSGPLRSAWRQLTVADEWPAAPWTALVSTLLVLSMLSFMTLSFNPFSRPYAGFEAWGSQAIGEIWVPQALGVVGIIVYTSLFMGAILLLLERFHLPAGAITLIVGLCSVFMSALGFGIRLIPFAIGGAVTGELLIRLVGPRPESRGKLRTFAFAFPFTFYCLYFLGILLTMGSTWSIELWMGSIVVAGLEGLLISYLLVPPRVVS